VRLGGANWMKPCRLSMDETNTRVQEEQSNNLRHTKRS
jgi:hypothetical protein